MRKAALAFLMLVLLSLACGTDITINFTDDTPTAAVIVEIAGGKPTSASSYWYYSDTDNFPSDAAVDGKTQELDCVMGVPEGNSYWLLAERNTGWVQVDLLREYPIVEIRWLNTHNGRCQDRATTRFHISLSKSGAFSGEEIFILNGEMQMESAPQFQSYQLPQPVRARFVRFYVDAFRKNGGGLNELQVYAIE
jgi:hypothetical protein